VLQLPGHAHSAARVQCWPHSSDVKPIIMCMA